MKQVMVRWACGVVGMLSLACGPMPDCRLDVSGQWHDEEHGGQVRIAPGGFTSDSTALWAREGNTLPGEKAVLDMVLRSSDRSSLQQDQDLTGTRQDQPPTDGGTPAGAQVHLDLKTAPVACRPRPPEYRCELHYRFALDGVGGERELSGHIEAWRITGGFTGGGRERVAQWPVQLRRNEALPETCVPSLGGLDAGVASADAGTARTDAGEAP